MRRGADPVGPPFLFVRFLHIIVNGHGHLVTA